MTIIFFLTFPALLSYPFLDLWKRNAVTVPKDYSSSESDEGSPLPIQESLEVCAYNNDGGSEVSLKVKSQHCLIRIFYIIGYIF